MMVAHTRIWAQHRERVLSGVGVKLAMQSRNLCLSGDHSSPWCWAADIGSSENRANLSAANKRTRTMCLNCII